MKLNLELFLLACLVLKVQSQVSMTQSPASVVLPDLDETVLECRMNIPPDRFQWRHYPVTGSLAYTSKYPLVLSEARHYEIPSQEYRTDNASTSFKVENRNISVAGDYQCLAHYGAVVFASKPGRISISTLKQIPYMESIKKTIIEGNTVMWKCPEPESNPIATMEYYKGDAMIYPKYAFASSLIIENVKTTDSGTYTCKAYNTITRVTSNIYLGLNVVPANSRSRQKPEFLVLPKQKYTVLQGSSTFLECAAVGSPIPKVKWSKLDSSQLPNNTIIEKGGLYIKNMMQFNEGNYICEHHNSEGNLKFQIEVEYQEAPIVRGPFKREVKSDKLEEGQDLDIECDVTGVPKPTLSWFLNGHSVTDDPHVSIHGNIIRFRPLHKRHAGMIQCFANNIVSTDYGTTTIEVFPKQIFGSQNQESSTLTNHRNRKTKHRKLIKPTNNMMIPPSKPTVTRVNDESVVVRWTSNSNNGLEIKFFKVQYRDTSQQGATWITTNADIDPHIRSFDVTGLQPDHSYRFRVAAVYSNDDNKLSEKSDTFHLHRLDFFDRNDLPVPTITTTETINATTIQVFWDYTPHPNITINGFYVNYISASSAGDYNKATVDGDTARSYIISHLEPGTTYDFKMQTFTSKSASDFSQRMRGKTAPIVVETTTILPVKKQETNDGSNLYIILAVSIVGLICLFTVVALLIVCCKWKKKKEQNHDGGVKQPTEEMNHHIETHKTSRTNGFVTSGNHITIRSNPLAETDNKTQNMIEMSCLAAAQNNNCSAQTSTGRDGSREIHNNVGKTKKQKGENYV